MAPPTKRLLAGLDDRWAAATVGHPFVAAAIDGSLKPEQFDRWLAQDYFFVRGFAPLAGALLASAPDAHLEPLVGGVAALQDELRWFQATAARRGLDLAATPLHPACSGYREFMRELRAAPYAVAAAGFWAMEKCYNEAWGAVLDGAGSEEYREYAHRWGNQEFGHYVRRLAAHADEALAAAPEHEPAARAAVERVAELEVAFWSMAYSDG